MARNEAASSSAARSGSAPALQGKSAVVTGSTSGIGLGIARALAGAGCDVMLNGFGEAAAIETVRAQIAKDFGVRAGFNSADMAKPAEIERMVEAATASSGQVDILVNNAGIQYTAPVEDFPGRAMGCGHRHQPLVRISTRSVPPFRKCANAIGAASSTSPRRTGSWHRWTRRPTWRRSMGWSA